MAFFSPFFPRLPAVGICSVITLASLASPLLAQSASQTGSTQAMTLDTSASIGYDSNILGDSQAAATSAPLGGVYGATTVGVGYSRTEPRASFGGSGGTTVRHYRTSQPLTPYDFFGTVNIASSITGRLHWGASADASRATQYTLYIFPSLLSQSAVAGVLPVLSPLEAPTPSLDTGLFSTTADSFGGGVAVSYALSRRSTISANYSSGRSSYGGAASRVGTSRAVGSYGYHLTKYAELHLGYGIQASSYSGTTARHFRGRIIDAGINFARPLSFSRRTVLFFGISTVATDEANRTLLTVGGNLNLRYQATRRWSLNVSTARGVQFLNGLREPVLNNGVNAAVDGRINRISVNGSASYSRGTVGLVSSALNNYSTYAFSMRATAPVTRKIGTYVEYLNYYSSFNSFVVLPENVAHLIHRNTIRAGVSMTLPLIERKSRATR